MRTNQILAHTILCLSIISVSFCAFPAFVCGFDNDGFGVNPLTTIMPFGDSNTKGFQGDPAFRGAYRFELEKMLIADNVGYDMVGDHQRKQDGMIDADHQALGGYGVERMTVEFQSAVERYQPDYILVLAGTNDHMLDPNYDASYQRYDDLLSMLTVASPESRVIISTLPKFGYDRPSRPNWTKEFVDYRNNVVFPTMNSAIFSASENFSQVSVVDLFSIFDVNTDLTEDRIHMNRVGHKKLADLYYAQMNSSPTSIPEPGSCGIAGIALVTILMRRRRKL